MKESLDLVCVKGACKFKESSRNCFYGELNSRKNSLVVEAGHLTKLSLLRAHCVVLQNTE